MVMKLDKRGIGILIIGRDSVEKEGWKKRKKKGKKERDKNEEERKGSGKSMRGNGIIMKRGVEEKGKIDIGEGRLELKNMREVR